MERVIEVPPLVALPKLLSASDHVLMGAWRSPSFRQHQTTVAELRNYDRTFILLRLRTKNQARGGPMRVKLS